jgi:hypothetical protein
MTQMTDRVQNQKIIELAKQQFEQVKKSKLPTIIADLPSQGKVYPSDSILSSGQIEMRYLTAYDEDILTNISYIKNGVVFDKLLESIITSPVNVAEIISSDKDALIINARILAYGDDYAVSVPDPKTGKQLDTTFKLSNLKPKTFNLTNNDRGEFSYTVSDTTQLKFTYQIQDGDGSIVDFLEQTITEVNGNRNKTDISDFIRYEFLAMDSRKFRKYVKDNMPGLDMNCEFEGEDGSTFIAGFPISADLFWF